MYFIIPLKGIPYLLLGVEQCVSLIFLIENFPFYIYSSLPIPRTPIKDIKCKKKKKKKKETRNYLGENS